MAMRIKTTLTITMPPGAVEKTMRQYQGDCMVAGIEQWIGSYLPQHFQVGAAGKYGYQKRTKAYMLRKAKKFHHQQPLVYSGESRVRMLSQMTQIAGRGPHTTVTATWSALPWYFSMQPRNTAQPNKKLEVITTLPDEATEMARVYQQRMEFFLRQNRTEEVITT